MSCPISPQIPMCKACRSAAGDALCTGGQRFCKALNLPSRMRFQAAASADWVVSGAVTSVKDQSTCGSCWAFSSAAALEGAHFIKTGELKSFSEQQQVSCNTECYGCGGGWSYKAFDFWKTNSAFLEDAYPYTSGSGDSGTCQQESLVSTDV